jgi:hypothetical protein
MCASVAVGFPVFHVNTPNPSTSYRKLRPDEAYVVIRLSSSPDTDYQHEYFEFDTFFDRLAEEHPASVIVRATLYVDLQRHDGACTSMLASWDAPYNHARPLVLTVVEGVRVACG